MEVRVHHDPPEFWALARPIFAADPMRHTHGLSVIRRIVDAPDPEDEPPTLLTLWNGGRIAGAAFRTPPWPVGVSAVPLDAMEATASALLEVDLRLPGVSGPRDAAEPFAEMWSKLTGATVRELIAMRLYRLGRLESPTVPGQARLATEDDVPLVARWATDFQIEALGKEREPGRADLANPVSNSIYQRIGYRPVYDQTELQFDR